MELCIALRGCAPTAPWHHRTELALIADDDLGDRGPRCAHGSIARIEFVADHGFGARGLRRLGVGRELDANLASARQRQEPAVLPVGGVAAVHVDWPLITIR